MSSAVRMSPILPVGIVSTVGLVCTLLLVDWVREWENGLERASFQIRASARVDAIEQGMSAALSDLNSVVDMFDALDGNVSPEQFETFSAALLARTPFVRGLTVYRHVLDRDRDAFEQARRKSRPDYSILELRDGRLEPAARRPTYRVIDMLSPFKEFERAYGVDADTISPLLKTAVWRSGVTGFPYMGRLPNLVAAGATMPHVMMLLPLYRAHPESDAQREAALYGWVSSIMRARDLVENTQSERLRQHGYRVELYAGEGGHWDLVHATADSAPNTPDTPDGKSTEGDRHVYQRIFTVAQRDWRVEVSAPGFSVFDTHLASLLASLIGVLGTLSLCAYLYLLVVRSRRIETLVDARTLELNHANAMLVSDIAVREAQNRILHIIAAGHRLSDILDEIIGFSELRLARARCMIVLLRSSQEQELVAAPNVSPELAAVLARLASSAATGWLRHAAAASGHAELAVSDLRNSCLSADDQERLEQAAVSSLSAWPIASKNGETLGVFFLMRTGRNGASDGDGAVARIATDLAGIVIESRRAEEQIRHLAHYDELTGLPNRSLFTEHLQKALEKANRSSVPVAILFIDLDRFKNINDTFGHDAGDEVLRCLSLSFRSCLRTPDKVARLGGDEFIVLVEDYSDPHYLGEIATRLLQEASKPFEIAGQECHLGASIGIAVYPDDGRDATVLVKNADMAMYRAKTIGRGNFQFYSPEMNTHTLNRLALESSLRKALERNEFVVHYQPKVEVSSGRMIGAEALVRWQQDGQELMLPATFVPFAEEIGLISTIGMRVLDTACRDIRRFQQEGVDFGRIAINLSGLQFNDTYLVHDVKDVIADAGISPSRLEFEITESMVMHNRDRAVRLMEAIRDLGITLSIDDFGTGYSSLASLRQFPVDSVKIDKSFIEDLSDDQNGVAIVHAIIAMGHSLGLRVTAEGVETQRQLEVLRRFGCDEYQGYYFSPALPARQFIEFASRQPVPAFADENAGESMGR